MAKVLSGVSFPFRTEGQGLPAKAQGVEVVRSALIVLLKTKKGSRVMRPTLGTNLHKLIFETSSPELEALIQSEIISAVSDELPMVKIEGINIIRNDTSTIQVNVAYNIQGVVDQTGPINIGSG